MTSIVMFLFTVISCCNTGTSTITEDIEPVFSAPGMLGAVIMNVEGGVMDKVSGFEIGKPSFNSS